MTQVSTNYANHAIVRAGNPYILDSETFAQDGARVAALAQYTVVAQNATTRKWVPLTVVDPTLTPGNLVCGAVGGSQAAFAAVSAGSFRITVDGVLISITGLDFTDIPSVLDTLGNMVCGAIGGTQAAFAAVADGSFRISIDGAALSLTGLDFTDIVSQLDTNATGLCAVNGANLAAWQAIADGSVACTVDGVVVTMTALNFTGITNLANIADILNYHSTGRMFWAYNSQANVFRYVSLTQGATSTLSVLSTGGAGTDISGAGHLAGGAATLVQGTGADGYGAQIADVINRAAAGRFECAFDGDEVIFLSPTTGVTSTVSVLTAGAAGTDISGVSFLNGLTGVGTVTAGTGHDGYFTNIADVINQKALGRFWCVFDGDEFTFISPTPGVYSAVTVLTSGLAGTDISGTGFLNGLTGVGTVTAGTGANGENLPAGLLWSDSITAASLVAGDVTGKMVLIGGAGVALDANQVTYENSLTANTVVVARSETIASCLRSKGLYLQSTRDISAYQS